ncbi:hypothetical protein GQ53DRAFT_749243 [Thozetella sp. PMI_491]|nr:hypothetical protein GQ53DRAFT_749243 [Thozetella sp. PMI_491]
MAEGEAPKVPVVAEAHEVDTFHPPEKMLAKHPSKPHLASKFPDLDLTRHPPPFRPTIRASW